MLKNFWKHLCNTSPSGCAVPIVEPEFAHNAAKKAAKDNAKNLVDHTSKSYWKHNDLLYGAVDPKTDCWKDTCHVFKETNLQFHGISLTLYSDGTYCLCDTTGG